MLEISTIRFEKERVLEGLNKRFLPEAQIGLIETILLLDDERKKSQTEGDIVLSEINKLSKEIGDLFKSGKQSKANELKDQVAVLKDKSKILEENNKRIQQELGDLIIQLPNVPHVSVPVGKHAEDNEVYKEWSGDLDILPSDALPHWEIAEKYGVFSLTDGVKLTGAGFPVFKGKGARLQRALISYFLDEASKAGYTEIVPPLVVNHDSARATGQLPDKEAQMYYIERDDLYLIPTAEVPITNLYRDMIVSAEELPIKLTGYTPCFRREAGSYGADVKGLNRVHQFDKIEIVQIQHPDKSYDSLMEMLNHVSHLLDSLGLPYRILRLCGGDMGFASALTYDFEVYSMAQKRWLEVSSVSNFETFQSNRMMLRYKDTNGKNKLAHTLNGSALALARIVAAILENFQTKDGVIVPEVLRKYTGFDIIN
ncbi:MAG TPA: serine--tRNA ligase [Saprospiraceae bacterium]|nr:serine--tRNA ligase [Saprospiraceae bacterium]